MGALDLVQLERSGDGFEDAVGGAGKVPPLKSRVVVDAADAGAASGVVNVAHQLGGSLGLGILVTVFAAAGSRGLPGNALLAHRVSAALTAGSVMLALALVVVVTLVVRPGRAPCPISAVAAPARTASA